MRYKRSVDTSPLPGTGDDWSVSARTRRDERARLQELIEAAEAEHGPVDPAAVAVKAALLRGGPEGPTAPDGSAGERPSPDPVA